ncbi:MAG TPA: recombination mediator RecR [Gammaproteobacteria bacterium]
MSHAYSPLLQRLVDALQCLPGVGPKSAQRMVFHLLDKDRAGAERLARALDESSRGVRHCERCRLLTEEMHCAICTSARRDESQLCVVETHADVAAIEQSGAYRGLYFVLMGHLSPIDGIGPVELGLELLERRLRDEKIEEVVLATSVTVEGDATAHIIASLARRLGIRASRIAYGIPMGGELEFVDSGTLSRAMSGRRDIEISSNGGDG